MKILVATENAGKLCELQAVGAEFGLELLSPVEVATAQGLVPAPQVEETGQSYRENALLKAEALSAWSGLWTLGDDSGFEVRALGGQPGIFSARYGGVGLSSAERNALLIAELQKLEAAGAPRDRRAEYVCHLCLKRPGLETLHVEVRTSGQVLDTPCGENGFGYDPIVLIDAIGCTFGEVDFSAKVQHGFRARAARELFRNLRAPQR